MKQCPGCNRTYEDYARFCPHDGERLPEVTEHDKLIGTLLDDKYRLREKIGEGGMGKVYKATHIHLDFTVAVKILHPEMASDQTALQRFRREARAACQLQHPNAVAVTDFGVMRSTGVPYLVMEFLEGVTLSRRIQQQKQLPYEECLVVLKQTCAAAHAAHSKGIIHRDLKPDNIWMVKDSSGIDLVKVLDFGIAKLKGSAITGPLLKQGMIIGTPSYMSPEQCLGEDLDARSDIYSLGIILYEMLTGEVPFKADTLLAVTFQQASEPPRPPATLRAGMPVQVQDVVLRALEKKREYRQESAIQMAQEFEASLYAAGLGPDQAESGGPEAVIARSPNP